MNVGWLLGIFKPKSIRIGPDRAYPLHFTHPQLLLLLLPVLPLLCVCETGFELRGVWSITDKNDGKMGWNLFLFVLGPIL